MATQNTVSIKGVKEKLLYGCTRCGKTYTTIKSHFYTNYGPLYKGSGYMSVCIDCVNALYAKYYEESRDERNAVRAVCRKLDLYWSDTAYDATMSKATTRSVMQDYIAKLHSAAFINKCYDDTLKNENRMWTFNNVAPVTSAELNEKIQDLQNKLDEANTALAEANERISEDEYEGSFDIPEEVRSFWGSGYTPSMYHELETRLKYWMHKLGDIELDAGTEALLRQICSLELDINRDRAAGKPVDKSVAALNNLLGSAMLKPSQKKDDTDASTASTPLGVWLYRYEKKRPLPEIDDDLKDVNGIKKYIFIWMGHVCKVVGLKNGFTRLYEQEIEKYRVEKPEYDDEDDETLLDDVLTENENGSE